MRKLIFISSNKNMIEKKGFTIIEMIIGISIAIISIGGIGFFMSTLGENSSNFGSLETVMTEKEELEKDLSALFLDYNILLMESGSIITKSNAGFENMIYTNVAETGGIMIGTVNTTNNQIIVSNNYTYNNYRPFISVLDSVQILAAKSDYNSFLNTFSGEKKIYHKLPIIAFGHYILNNGIEKFDIIFNLRANASMIGKDLYEIYASRDLDTFSFSILK